MPFDHFQFRCVESRTKGRHAGNHSLLHQPVKEASHSDDVSLCRYWTSLAFESLVEPLGGIGKVLWPKSFNTPAPTNRLQEHAESASIVLVPPLADIAENLLVLKVVQVMVTRVLYRQSAASLPRFPAGKEITAKVLEASDNRVRLSIKAALDDAERADFDNFRATANASGMGTLGDLLKAKLGKK